MTDQNLSLSSPLTEQSRKERRALLIVSALSLATTVDGLAPTKIEQLGIEFSQPQIGALVAVLLAMHAFLLVAFLISALAERRTWDVRFAELELRLATDDSSPYVRWEIFEKLGQPKRLKRRIDAIRDLHKAYAGHISRRVWLDVSDALELAAIARDGLIEYQQFGGIADLAERSNWRYYGRGNEPVESVEEAAYLVAHAQQDLRELIDVVIGPAPAKLIAGKRERTVRQRLIRRLYRKRLTHIDKVLRAGGVLYSEDLLKQLRVLTSTARWAGFADAARKTAQRVQNTVTLVAPLLDHADVFDLSSYEECVSSVFAARHGAEDADIDLEEGLTMLRDDVRRSLRRYRLQAFWDLAVPLVIAGTALLLAIVDLALTK